MKLRDRLTLTFTLVTVVALLTSFAVTYVLVARDEMRDLDRGLLGQAERAAVLAVERHPDDPMVGDASGDLPDVAGLALRYAAIYDRSGAILSATRGFENAPGSLQGAGLASYTASPRPFDLSLPGASLRAVILPTGGRRLMLYAVSRAAVDEDLRYLVRVFSALLAAGTLVTWLVARWLGRALSREVDAIAGVAEAVASGDLAARVGARAGGTVETNKLAVRLDQMIDRLSELVASQRAFVSSAAHELRSPLTSLRGELELALRRERGATEYKETIERALADAVALVALADDLLALARVEDRVKRPVRDAALVRDVLEDARHMARGNADKKRVRVVVGHDGDETAVRCPRQDGARALRNLLDNAIAHSPDGAEVTVGVEVEHGRALISVSDRGPGVPTDDEAVLFTPFYRGDAERAGEAEGAGLGLSLSREIARAYGGEVALDHAYTQGARFVLSLPLSPERAREL